MINSLKETIYGVKNWLLGDLSLGNKKVRSRRVRLNLEQLEERAVPTVVFVPQYQGAIQTNPVAGPNTVVVSNLSDTPAGTDTNTAITTVAQEFTTGSVALNLQSVALDCSGTGGQMSFSLYTNNSGQPGSSLLSLGTITPSGSGDANYKLTTSAFPLAANTAYWVVGNYLGTASWAFTSSTSFSGAGTLGSFAHSTNNGTSWTTFTIANGPYMVAVDATTSQPAYATANASV